MSGTAAMRGGRGGHARLAIELYPRWMDDELSTDTELEGTAVPSQRSIRGNLRKLDPELMAVDVCEKHAISSSICAR
jgi:hypothetical protein